MPNTSLIPKHPKNTRLLFGILIMTIIIDVMGMGLVIPVLPGLLLSPHSALLSHPLSVTARNWLYGLTLGAWPIGMFIGNAMIGALSDKLGRKPMIQLSLAGMALTYFLGWLAIQLHHPTLFILSRVLNGIFSGSFVLAQASIVDISPSDRVTQNLGWITFAATFGFVAGPLAASGMIAIFSSPSSPFLLATGLAALNGALLTLLLPKTPASAPTSSLRFWRTLFAFTILLRDRRIRILGQVFFIFQLAWGFYIQNIMAFMSEKEHLNAIQLALYMAMFGVGSVLNLLILQPPLMKKYSLITVAWIGLISFTLLFCAFPLYAGAGLWISAILLSATEILLYSALMGLFSAAVSPEEQGQIMGSVGSLFGISWGLIAFILPPLMSWSLYAPITAGAICLLISIWQFKDLKQQP